MKRLFQILAALVLVLALASCTVGRKNSAKTLKISSYEKSSNTYVLEYIGSTLDFGKLYLTVKDEQLVNVVCEFKNEYVLEKYQIKVGSYVSQMEEKTEGTKLTLSFKNPFKFVKEKNDEGVETLNSQNIVIFVQFCDARKAEVEAAQKAAEEAAQANQNNEQTFKFRPDVFFRGYSLWCGGSRYAAP